MTPKTLLVALSLLAAAPAAFADPFILGTPDASCQTPNEWRLHDYGSPAANDVITNVQDGNLEDCGYTTWLSPSSDECAVLVGTLAYEVLCLLDAPRDFDGDREYAQGGAILVSRSGDGVTNGGIACFGTVGHHPQGGTVIVVDITFGSEVPFSIAADWSSALLPPGGGPDCGDGTIQPCSSTGGPAPSTLPQPAGVLVDTVNAFVFELSNSPGTTCTPGDVLGSCPLGNNGSCTIPFPPGADGAYHVFVGRSLRPATQGHVYL